MGAGERCIGGGAGAAAVNSCSTGSKRADKWVFVAARSHLKRLSRASLCLSASLSTLILSIAARWRPTRTVLGSSCAMALACRSVDSLQGDSFG